MRPASTAAESDPAQPAAPAPGGPAQPQGFYDLPRRTVLATLGGVMVAMLMAALDQTIVGTAMPRVIAELHGFEHYAGVRGALAGRSIVVPGWFNKLSVVSSHIGPRWLAARVSRFLNAPT